MTEWQKELLAGDPLNREPLMSAAEVERMRRTVLAAAEHIPSRASGLMMALACSLSLATGAGVWAVRQGGDVDVEGVEEATTAPVAGVTAPDPPPIERRQVQFSTPGGTRVIWVLHGSFYRGNQQ